MHRRGNESMLITVVALTLVSVDEIYGQRVAHRFSPFEFAVPEGSEIEKPFNYRLYEPEWGDSREHFPLIVWLHGEGESGDDNVAQLRYLGSLLFSGNVDEEHPKFFILAVQKPKGMPWFSRSSPHTDAQDMLEIVGEIIKALMERLPIDRDRVYVSGVSSGGTATWELGARYPNRFAAIAPLASAGCDIEKVRRLVHMSVRAAHSRFDNATDPKLVRSTISALNQVGGVATLLEIESNKHDCWTAAFEQFHMLEWLLLQTRGTATRSLIGSAIIEHCVDFAIRSALIVSVSLIVIMAWKFERQRRRTLRRY